MKFIKKILPDFVYNRMLDTYKNIFGLYAVKSYSQEGEDLILFREFEYDKTGFYIDVGAYHPKRFSNTYFFYKKGWRGINIDARSESMSLFKKLRPRDINVGIPVSNKEEELTFYTFNEPAISGFLENLSLERAKKDGYKIIKSEKLRTKPLSEILDRYLPVNQEINFLSIDVEGFDYNVLVSNNWDKYRPKIILTEELDLNINDMLNSKIFLFLKEKGYDFFAKTSNTIFFKRQD